MRLAKPPGLVVAGSYVEKTSRQLAHLLNLSHVRGVEVSVERLLDTGRREDEIRRATAVAGEIVAEGRTAAVFTSRQKIAGNAGAFLQAGEVIAAR